MRLHKLSIYLLYLLIGISLFSCKENNRSVELLNQAQTVLDSNPGKALVLLDSIDNPQGMDKDRYMQYILAYVGAKQETKADIMADTLIFEAQKHFNDKGDFKNSAFANYYAGWVYYANNKLPQSLESFMHSVYQADKINNNLLAGKNFNNIGYIYFERYMLDSAIVNYRKALYHYDKEGNADKRKLRTFTYIGSAYDELNKPDSAYLYFDKCLSLAKETQNEAYQFYSLKNLGLVCYGKQEYEKAIDYFQSALALNVSEELEIQKINLYLLNIYNKKQDTKSAKQYAELVIASLPSVTYKYTAKEMCAALAEYYKQTGDFKQALEYSSLEKATKEQIEQEANVPALLEANKNFQVRRTEREAQEFRELVLWGVKGGVIALVIVLFFVFLARRDNRKGEAEMQVHIARYARLREKLEIVRAENDETEAKLKAILEDIDKEEGEGNK